MQSVARMANPVQAKFSGFLGLRYEKKIRMEKEIESGGIRGDVCSGQVCTTLYLADGHCLGVAVLFIFPICLAQNFLLFAEEGLFNTSYAARFAAS